MTEDQKAILRFLESAYIRAVNAKCHNLAQSIADMI